jgi:hypothetical protein
MKHIYIDEEKSHLYKANKERNRLYRFDLNEDDVDYSSQIEVAELKYPLYKKVQESVGIELKTLKVKSVDYSSLVVLGNKEKAYKLNYKRALLEGYEKKEDKWFFSTHVDTLEPELHRELEGHFGKDFKALNIALSARS